MTKKEERKINHSIESDFDLVAQTISKPNNFTYARDKKTREAIEEDFALVEQTKSIDVSTAKKPKRIKHKLFSKRGDSVNVFDPLIVELKKHKTLHRVELIIIIALLTIIPVVVIFGTAQSEPKEVEQSAPTQQNTFHDLANPYTNTTAIDPIYTTSLDEGYDYNEDGTPNYSTTVKTEPMEGLISDTYGDYNEYLNQDVGGWVYMVDLDSTKEVREVNTQMRDHYNSVWYEAFIEVSNDDLTWDKIYHFTNPTQDNSSTLRNQEISVELKDGVATNTGFVANGTQSVTYEHLRIRVLSGISFQAAVAHLEINSILE